MKPRAYLLRIILPIVISIVTIHLAKAQSRQEPGQDAELYKEIAHMDSVLFNAFNSRDVETFKTLFTADLEFFHDNSGLTNYDHTINFMNEVAKNNNQLRRELVKGSLEVYPIPGYGAMEIGSHSFCHMENGKQDCGTFKFVHIWQKKNGEWKISRVVSYGH